MSDFWEKLKPARPVPSATGVQAVHPVGNYALAFVFADGHSTGIFDWAYLRETAEKSPA